MTAENAFTALTMTAQCGGPSLLPCPEAMVMSKDQEACLHVDRDMYLARCKRQWEQDHYYPAAGYAVLFCTYNKLPLPAWLADVVNQAMLTAFEHGGRTTNRRQGGYTRQARRLEVHRHRWATVRMYKQQEMTDEEAFERASKDLRGSAAQGEPRQVEQSYRRIQRQQRDLVRFNQGNKGARTVR